MSNQHAILHIEDNLDNRVLIRRLLQSDGYQVFEAENAAQAMDIIHTHSPDLILMDINMPEVDGYTLTARLKELPEICKIPIIALTANVMKGDRERSLKAGCDGYIEKPIDVDSFLDLISRYIKR